MTNGEYTERIAVTEQQIRGLDQRADERHEVVIKKIDVLKRDLDETSDKQGEAIKGNREDIIRLDERLKIYTGLQAGLSTLLSTVAAAIGVKVK